MDQAKLDNQREVVKNERRQTLENEPYGVAEEALLEALYPAGHPYRHPIIGSMEDLDRATLEDVKGFFSRYYTPNNASLCVAGDIDPAEAMALVEKYFGAVPKGPIVSPVRPDVPVLARPVRVEVEDRVQLERLYLQWPAACQLTQDDAALAVLAYVLTVGKDSRLVRRLQVESDLAQSLYAYQGSGEVSSVFTVVATAQPGRDLAELERVAWEELDRVRSAGVEAWEVRAAVDSLKTKLVKRMEMVGGFGGVSDMLNYYQTFTGEPDGLPRDLARYEAVTPDRVREVALRWLHPDRYTQVTVRPARDKVESAPRAAMPGAAAPGAFRLPRPERRKLDNGLEVCVLPQDNIPLVSVQAAVRAGGIADPAERPGLAQFTAALLDEAAAGMGPLELAKRQKELATSLATGLDYEQASFGLTLLSDHFDGGLALLADVLLRPDLRPQDVERLRKEHLANLARKLDEPQELGDRALRDRLFGAGTPYGHPLDGTRASLEALLREEARAFYERRYRTSDTLLVIVGDVSPEEAFAAAGSAFGPWRGDDGVQVGEEGRGAGRAGLFLVDKPGAPQSYLTAAAPALSRLDPDYPSFVVFNAVLGGQFTSRINMNLREDKGYTYGARSYLEPKRGVLPWVLCTSVQTDKTLESVREILAELDRILSGHPVSEQEFENARNNLVLRYPQGFETQAQLADGLSSLWVYGLSEDYHERMLSALQSLTLHDVREAGRRHLVPERLVWVVVGDRAKIEAPVAEAGLGAPVVLDVGGMSGG
jgi:zinc protease